MQRYITANKLQSEDDFPVIHACWDLTEHVFGKYRCSYCCEISEGRKNYCPHCGAKMDLQWSGVIPKCTAEFVRDRK